MTKVLILSDSHGLTKEIVEIKNRHHLKYMIHCGDSELSMEDPVLEDIIKVRGNCDYDSGFPDEKIIKLDSLTFLITHGHLHDVRSGLTNLSYRATEKNAQIVCFGHTHIAGAKKRGHQIFINPGSIRLPRNRSEKTYAILEWETHDKIQVLFYNTNGKLIEDLTYITDLNDEM